ncbi:MAG: DUF1572 family protein [Bacteroidia bacterium]
MENSDFINSVQRQFEYYKNIADKTFEQVEDDKLFYKYNENSNSIAIIVQHLWGNMMSRWTDFLTTDGEKDWRQRDAEFEEVVKTREELLNKWNEGWECLFNALHSLKDEDFSKTVYIRNQGHSVMEAINRQLAHYPYHIGQIVYIGKMLQDGKWKSLSIPKNQSKTYNSDKFSQPKRKEHLTDEFLKKK